MIRIQTKPTAEHLQDSFLISTPYLQVHETRFKEFQCKKKKKNHPITHRLIGWQQNNEWHAEIKENFWPGNRSWPFPFLSKQEAAEGSRHRRWAGFLQTAQWTSALTWKGDEKTKYRPSINPVVNFITYWFSPHKTKVSQWRNMFKSINSKICLNN